MFVDEKRRGAQKFARRGVSLKVFFIKKYSDLQKHISNYTFSAPTSYPVYLLIFLGSSRQAGEILLRKCVLLCRL